MAALRWVDTDLTKAILVWSWEDAPEEYRKLSSHGGDEDWLALLPPDFGELPDWMESGSQFGCCDVTEHILPNGYRVVIGAHA